MEKTKAKILSVDTDGKYTSVAASVNGHDKSEFIVDMDAKDISKYVGKTVYISNENDVFKIEPVDSTTKGK